MDCRVSIYFLDPWVASLAWAFIDKGEILEAYSESHDKVLVNQNARFKRSDFWEDKFWEKYEVKGFEINPESYQDKSVFYGELR